MKIAKYSYLGGSQNPRMSVEFDVEVLRWVGRAYLGEHGDNYSYFELFIWTMLNRYLLSPGNRYWPTFVYMLRAFSQPVNPRWQRDGILARRFPNSRMCTEARFKRREQLCALDFSDFESPLLGRLIILQYGGLVPPDLKGLPILKRLYRPRPSNFAASLDSVVAKYPHGWDFGGNWYFEDKNLRNGVVAVDHWSL